MRTPGTKLLKIWMLIAAISLLSEKSEGQELGFSLFSYPSIGYNLVYEPGMNGAGASIFYNRGKFKKLNLSLSGEYAMTTWGHQGFFGFGG